MYCPECQVENAEDSKFCIKCGHNFLSTSDATLQALSYDEKIEKIQRYLPKGLTEKILNQKDKIQGERKQVTVMFCDMEGFTPLVDRIGAEEAYGIMDQVYEILIHNVHDFEGTVNEMTGDGIMALFGAPITLEDAPQRALWSALSIHRGIARFSDQKKGIGPIKMRIGIHTGPVIVGTLGNDLRVEFKAVGNTVNLAHRMEELAEAGATYVTEETFKLTSGLFRFEAIGKKSVKGKKKSIPVYKVISHKESVYRPRLGSERMIFSEMVGRDNELGRLELQVLKAINDEGSVINIIGEAGIGKSRLVAELKKCDVMKRVNLLEGRAISIGRNLSFHPIIDILKQWAQIRKDDGELTALDKLETAIRNLSPEQVVEVLPFVATLMGMNLYGKYAERIKGIEGEALEKLILKNVRELLIKAAELTPLAIVMEDLHWADTSSLELMESLFRLAETRRILFINIFRPGHKETGDRIVQTIKEKLSVYYVEIALEPLDKRMSEALITNMLNIRGLSHTVSKQIVERTGGNPFFIEEVVRSFIDEGVLVLKNEGFEVTGKIDAVVIPQSVFDVLMARIDRLEQKTRSLIKVASVIGRNFYYRILIDVAPTIENIDNRLSLLNEVQLIEERKGMKEIEYQFKHALAQEAAYQSLLHERRRKLHLKVADSIENVFHERLSEFYGMLAYHYSRAENLEKTEEYLIKAGKEALRTSASSEALNYYREGLKLYLKRYGDAADPEKLAAFEKNIALAFFNKGQHENALMYFDSVLDRWGEGSPKNRLSLLFKLTYHLLSMIANLYLPLREEKRAPDIRDKEIIALSYKRSLALVHVNPKRCFTEFISILKKLNRFDIAEIENGVGIRMSASGLFSWSGISFTLSRKILEHNKSIVKKDDYKQILYYDFFELLNNAHTGNWFDVKEYDGNLVSRNLRVGESWHVLNYLLFHGYIRIDQGNFEGAKAIISKVAEIWEVYGNENALAVKRYLELRLLVVRRKLYDARILADDAYSRSETLRPAILYYLGYKAIIQILLKDLHGVKAALLQAREISNKKNLPPIYVSSYIMGQFFYDLYLLEQATLSSNKADIAKYRKRARQSSKYALRNAGKYAFNKTEALKLTGLYWWLIDSPKKAAKFWSRSVGEAERLGACVELARTYAEIGRRLTEKKSKLSKLNGIAADEYLEKAGFLFEEMDLRWDIDELSRIVASR